MHWNDRTRSALEGHPFRNAALITAGQVAGTTLTLSIPENAAVHLVFVESHAGDAFVTFPASSGGSTLHVHNNGQVSLDFRGFLAGGDFTIEGTGSHYLLSYVMPP